MPVNTTCDDYKLNIDKWIKCRIVAQGEESVKKAGTAYLPSLVEQSPKEYETYKDRALFYGATSRTLSGLLGAIFRKSPVVTPDNTRVSEELKSVTPDHQSARSFAAGVILEVLTIGRIGVMIDAPQEEGGKPYLISYKAESIINWKYENTGEGLVLTLVVLEESYEAVGDDEFESKIKTQYRVLELVNGVYQQRVFRGHAEAKKGTELDFFEVTDLSAIPKVSGANLDYIPFVFINPVDLTGLLQDSPVLALVNVNLSHYRSSADLEHGRHFTGLPTAWVAGFEKTDAFRIGSQVAWVSEEPDAHAGFLEFTGQGLGSLENALKEKQEMMAVLGARMLEGEKRAVESGNALATRYRGEHNVLANVSKVCTDAFGILFTWLMQWRGVSAEIEYQLNTDFINDKLNAQDIKALMETWQAGAISWDTLFFNFKRGEIYPEDVDMDMEQGSLEKEENFDVGSFGADDMDEEEDEDEEDDIEEDEETDEDKINNKSKSKADKANKKDTK